MRLNRGQRVVLVIGWGLILWTLADAMAAEWAPATDGGEWFNYAPNKGVLMSDPFGASRNSAAIWLGAVLLWIAGSLLLLRSPRQPSN